MTAILIPFFIHYIHIQWLGFPDGHLTELDRFQKDMFPVFSTVSVLFGFLFMSCAVKLSPANKKFALIALGVYFLLVVLAFSCWLC